MGQALQADHLPDAHGHVVGNGGGVGERWREGEREREQTRRSQTRHARFLLRRRRRTAAARRGGNVGPSLSTSSMTVTSLVPNELVALQMYSPESWRPTLGSTRLLSTTLCLQGRGERSLDQVMVGDGNPAERKNNTFYCDSTEKIFTTKFGAAAPI